MRILCVNISQVVIAFVKISNNHRDCLSHHLKNMNLTSQVFCIFHSSVFSRSENSATVLHFYEHTDFELTMAEIIVSFPRTSPRNRASMRSENFME